MKQLRFVSVLTIALFVLLSAGSALAQKQQPGGIPPLFLKLDLTEEQKGKLTPIFANQAKEIKALKDNTTLSEADRETKTKEIRRNANKEVMAILTADQRAKLKELRQQQNQNGGAPAEQPKKP
ncbi:MAG: Spy/CpxP family protein refolding chaperone [Blastocatellia bacterium]